MIDKWYKIFMLFLYVDVVFVEKSRYFSGNVIFYRGKTILLGYEKWSKICRIILRKKNRREKGMRKVYRLIRQLGVTSKYKGYYYVAEAVRMFNGNSGYIPIKITKDIYPSLAKQFKSTPG